MKWREVYYGGKMRKAKWRVIYPDGSHSVPLLKDDARTRARLHDAELVRIVWPVEPEPSAGGKP